MITQEQRIGLQIECERLGTELVKHIAWDCKRIDRPGLDVTAGSLLVRLYKLREELDALIECFEDLT